MSGEATPEITARQWLDKLGRERWERTWGEVGHLHNLLDAFAERIVELEESTDECVTIIARQGELLTGVANALKGPPGPLHWHDHADLPQVAQEMVDEFSALLDQPPT